MPIHETHVRVRYAETDQGGVVYNASYLVYFEVGRTEMMRAGGLPYRELEERGIVLPVVESHVRYRAPARYDDLLAIESRVSEVRRVRMRIDTRISDAGSGRLLAEGWVWLACTRSGAPAAFPDDLRGRLENLLDGKNSDSESSASGDAGSGIGRKLEE